MTPATAVKTNPSPVVIDNAMAAELIPSASPSFSFPIGYYDLHPDISVNFQLNRFYGWVDDESMLTETRGVGGRERLSDVHENRSRPGREGARPARGAQRGLLSASRRVLLAL